VISGQGFYARTVVAAFRKDIRCAKLSIRGYLERHSSYLQNWLTVLRQDKTTLFRAAADASRASDYLHSLQPAANADRAA
jgi:antirestriction protein ArdC